MGDDELAQRIAARVGRRTRGGPAAGHQAVPVMAELLHVLRLHENFRAAALRDERQLPVLHELQQLQRQPGLFLEQVGAAQCFAVVVRLARRGMQRHMDQTHTGRGRPGEIGFPQEIAIGIQLENSPRQGLARDIDIGAVLLVQEKLIVPHEGDGAIVVDLRKFPDHLSIQVGVEKVVGPAAFDEAVRAIIAVTVALGGGLDLDPADGLSECFPGLDRIVLRLEVQRCDDAVLEEAEHLVVGRELRLRQPGHRTQQGHCLVLAERSAFDAGLNKLHRIGHAAANRQQPGLRFRHCIGSGHVSAPSDLTGARSARPVN